MVPRAWLISVTVAPGTTAPCGSFNEPDTVPVVICAAAGTAPVGTILFVQVGSDDLNQALSESEVRTLEEERLDHVLTGAPTEVSETEAQLGPNTREAFERGAAEGISRGFAAVCLSIGIACLLAMVAWLLLMRPARAP